MGHQDGAFVALLDENSCVSNNHLSCEVTCDVGEKIEERGAGKKRCRL